MLVEDTTEAGLREPDEDVAVVVPELVVLVVPVVVVVGTVAVVVVEGTVEVSVKVSVEVSVEVSESGNSVKHFRTAVDIAHRWMYQSLEKPLYFMGV